MQRDHLQQTINSLIRHFELKLKTQINKLLFRGALVVGIQSFNQFFVESLLGRKATLKKRNIITGTLDLVYSSLQVDDLYFGVSVGSPDVFAQSPAVASCPGDVGFEFHVVSAGNVEGSGDFFL